MQALSKHDSLSTYNKLYYYQCFRYFCTTQHIYPAPLILAGHFSILVAQKVSMYKLWSFSNSLSGLFHN